MEGRIFKGGHKGSGIDVLEVCVEEKFHVTVIRPNKLYGGKDSEGTWQRNLRPCDGSCKEKIAILPEVVDCFKINQAATAEEWDKIREKFFYP